MQGRLHEAIYRRREQDPGQFAARVDDYVGADNRVRVIEAFVDQLDLREMGFESVDPEMTGRPAYHPSVMLKIYIYGYLNRVQSSRRLEYESQRNLELLPGGSAARAIAILPLRPPPCGRSRCQNPRVTAHAQQRCCWRAYVHSPVAD